MLASGPSLADIAAVTGNQNNDGFGGGNGWWVLIILFALFGGWGNGNGYGNNGGGALTRADLCQDMNFGQVENGVRGIQQGICDSTFALNNTITSSFTGVDNAICNLGYTMQQGNFALQQAINNDSNALSRQLADCCCENRAAIAQVRYDMATDTCAINNGIHQTGDAIIQNQNQGFNMLNQTIQNGFTNLAMQQKDQQIAELTAKLNICDRDNALQGTASYIINNLNPTLRSSYIVPNPNCCYNYNAFGQSYGCNGFNSGCCGAA